MAILGPSHSRIEHMLCMTKVWCAGDTVSKLLWRMKNGEVPLKREPRVAVVLVGTEDLVSPACRESNAVHKAAADLRGLLVFMHR